jgi:hypothetical protein
MPTPFHILHLFGVFVQVFDYGSDLFFEARRLDPAPNVTDRPADVDGSKLEQLGC